MATGSRSGASPIPGLAEAGYWTNREALVADRLPEALVVIGAGPIGLELGQVLLRFGSRVTVLEMEDQILPRFGVAIHTSARVLGVHTEAGNKIVSAEIAGELREFPADEILVATGGARTPRI